MNIDELLTCVQVINEVHVFIPSPSDIDECETSPCEGICTNTGGGYFCSCEAGYELASDLVSCKGKDYQEHYD